jgi:hypothetical protein
MINLKKIVVALQATLVVFSMASVLHAQDQNNNASNTLDGSATNSNSAANVSGITASNSVGNDASAQSGGNVFDFSNSSKSMGNAPGLGSFGGGPCMGVSGSVSASLPGFGLGGGRSFDDISCQRRNWVNTLLGAANLMPEVEARELKRVAIVVMMQDPILGPAFKQLGYNVEEPGTEVSSAKGVLQKAVPAASQKVKTSIGSMSSVCSTVVPPSASPAFIKLIEERGCIVEVRK